MNWGGRPSNGKEFAHNMYKGEWKETVGCEWGDDADCDAMSQKA